MNESPSLSNDIQSDDNIEMTQQINIILDKFKTKLNKQPENSLRKEEFLNFLDGLQDKKFDRNIAKKIFNLHDENNEDKQIVM